ncbi:MAG: metal ABC transporter permease [Planctomycetota bacterium]
MLESFFADVHNRAMLMGVVCNASCALVGCLLVLRRMSLMGDALSHAILPGLVVALLVSGDGGPVALLAGALGAGLVTTLLTGVAQRQAGVAADASLGVVYTTLFALGVVLVKQGLTQVHFDVACVYEGSLLQVALRTQTIAGARVPEALLVAGPVLLILVSLFVLLWKEWKLTSFDPALAGTMGFAPGAMHYLLMLLVSLTVMTSFEAVGSILVVAMLIGPAATAHLLTDRLAPMMVLSVIISTATTITGYQAAVALDVSPAGMIAVTTGVAYAAAALLGPRYGILVRLAQHARLALRVRREDLLAKLYRRREAEVAIPLPARQAAEEVGGGWLGRRAVSQLLRRGEAEVVAGALTLTETGAAEGRRLVRSHRLWETYLVEELGLPTDHVHEPAHRIEHFLDPDISQAIESELATQPGAEPRDPHGREIPK